VESVISPGGAGPDSVEEDRPAHIPMSTLRKIGRDHGSAMSSAGGSTGVSVEAFGGRRRGEVGSSILLPLASPSLACHCTLCVIEQ
jgi:hypothetical protein